MSNQISYCSSIPADARKLYSYFTFDDAKWYLEDWVSERVITIVKSYFRAFCNDSEDVDDYLPTYIIGKQGFSPTHYNATFYIDIQDTLKPPCQGEPLYLKFTINNINSSSPIAFKMSYYEYEDEQED